MNTVTYVTCKVVSAAQRTAVLHPNDRLCPLCGGDLFRFGTHVETTMKV